MLQSARRLHYPPTDFAAIARGLTEIGSAPRRG
jgi:hypothetical protein